MIYSPREDSFLLEKQVKIYSRGKSFLDMGSGSGIQSRAALSVHAKSVLAADINGEALKHLNSQKIPAVKSDLFSNIKQKFDVIAFNPPYLPRDKREDAESSRATAGGKRGDEIILKFLKQAKSHLNSKGIILLLVSSLTPKDKILNLLENNNMKKKILSKESFFMETLEVWKITKPFRFARGFGLSNL